MKYLRITGGSTIGFEHLRRNIRNQDSYHWVMRDGLAIVVVTDGCSGYPDFDLKSEVGAIIGDELVTAVVQEIYESSEFDISQQEFWNEVSAEILFRLTTIAMLMGRDIDEVLHKYFLFTIVVGVVTDTVSVFASIGDGYWGVNGEVFEIAPLNAQTPGYLADGDPVFFTIQMVLPTAQLQTFFLGSDGLTDFIKNQESLVPGRKVPVGPLSQFWEYRIYQTNPLAIENHLRNVGKHVEQVQWKQNPITVAKFPSLLSDDTTIVVGVFQEEFDA